MRGKGTFLRRTFWKGLAGRSRTSASLSRRPGGQSSQSTGAAPLRGRMAPRGTGSSRAQEWRPVEHTRWLLTAGLPLGASCPSNIQETAALQRRIPLSLSAQSSCSQTARWGQPRGLATGHSAPHLPAEGGTLGLGGNPDTS